MILRGNIMGNLQRGLRPSCGAMVATVVRPAMATNFPTLRRGRGVLLGAGAWLLRNVCFAVSSPSHSGEADPVLSVGCEREDTDGHRATICKFEL